LDRKVGRFLALENAIDVTGGIAKLVSQIGSMDIKPPGMTK
jgi:hypothetical protein